MRTFVTGILAACSLAGPPACWAEDAIYVTLRSLTAPLATKLALAAYEDCTAKGYHVATAVVGRDGRLLALVRSPLSGAHTVQVSEGKAFSAATFRTATSQLMGRDFMRDIPGALIWGGGLPIEIGGHFYGGVGVSGAPENETPGDIDEECAAAGIGAVSEEIELGSD